MGYPALMTASARMMVPGRSWGPRRKRGRVRLQRLLSEQGLPVLRAYGVQRVWLFWSVLEGRAGRLPRRTCPDLNAAGMVWPLRRYPKRAVRVAEGIDWFREASTAETTA